MKWAKKIYLSGYTAYPPRDDLHKTALGAEDVVPWEYFSDPINAVKHIKKANITLVLIEQTQYSKSIYDIDWKFPICFIVGNEVHGVSEELSALCDIHLEIPMNGIKQSLNVSVAAGIAGFELLRQYLVR